MSMEPNIASGDCGDHVTSLQERLQRLGYYDGAVDGYYGPRTEESVRWLQEAFGHEQDGHVQEATWQAIEHQESLLAGGTDGGSTGGGEWDAGGWYAGDGQPDGGSAAGHSPDQDASPVGQLSPEGHWQWDGAQWQPVAGGPLLGSPGPLHPGDLQLGDLGGGAPTAPVGAQPLQLDGGDQTPGVHSSSSSQTLTGFATNSAELTPDHQAVLAQIAADLNANPLILGGYLTLTGYADRRGNEADNQALGQRRADAVRDYLQQLVTDEQTRQQIRAYSLGAPSDGPTGDVPSLRKVEVQITRRTYHVDLGAMHPTPTLPGGGTPDLSLPEILRLPNPPIPRPGEDEVHLPDWFWRELPPRPPQPSLISQVSRWLNQTLHTHDIAGVAADVASAFGFDRTRVQRMLDDTFQSGGEAALKALLRQAIEGVAGHPSSPPSSPTGPPVDPRPFPTPQAQTPNIPTP